MDEKIIAEIQTNMYIIDSLNEFSQHDFEIFLIDLIFCYDDYENCIISDFYKLYENILKITEKMKINEKKMLLRFKFVWLMKEIKYWHNFYDDEKIIKSFTYDVSLIRKKGGLL